MAPAFVPILVRPLQPATGIILAMDANLLLPIVAETIDRYMIETDVLACDDALSDTAAFCEHYKIPLEEAANTIVVASRKVEPARLAVCVVLGATRLDVNKKVCELLDVRKAGFMDQAATADLTGMQIGGVVAVGISELPIYIDAAVMQQPRVVMGGGNRTSKLHLAPTELLKLPNTFVIECLAKPKDAAVAAEDNA